MENVNYLEKVKKAFPNAIWEKPGVLPSWSARHGLLELKRGPAKRKEYSKKYPFAGCAKWFDIEARGNDGDIVLMWNEQLVPWPWFVLVVAIPGDDTPLEDRDPDEKRCYLIFCDESGVYALQTDLSEAKEGFEKIRKLKIKPRAPNFIPENWDDITLEVWEKVILKKGELLTIYT